MNKNNNIIYKHTVWPMTKNFVIMMQKINKDLIKDGVWKVLKFKNGFYVKKANIKLFNNFIKEKVKNDPFYPVHRKTKTWMTKFLKEEKKISQKNFES